MKRKMKMLISLVLICLLLFANSTAVSAEYVSWSDNEGGKTLFVNVGEDTSDERSIDMEPQTHTYGVPELLSYSGNVSVSTYAVYTTAGAYQQYLVQAMNKSGLKTSYSISGNYTISAYVDQYLPTGDYVIAVKFLGYEGSWSVVNGYLADGARSQSYAISPLRSGTITYAPTGGVQGYFVKPA